MWPLIRLTPNLPAGIQFHPKHPIPGSLLPNTIKEDDLAFGEVGLVPAHSTSRKWIFLIVTLRTQPGSPEGIYAEGKEGESEFFLCSWVLAVHLIFLSFLLCLLLFPKSLWVAPWPRSPADFSVVLVHWSVVSVYQASQNSPLVARKSTSESSSLLPKQFRVFPLFVVVTSRWCDPITEDVACSYCET